VREFETAQGVLQLSQKLFTIRFHTYYLVLSLSFTNYAMFRFGDGGAIFSLCTELKIFLLGPEALLSRGYLQF
jgi:hypothetical protein